MIGFPSFDLYFALRLHVARISFLSKTDACAIIYNIIYRWRIFTVNSSHYYIITYSVVRIHNGYYYSRGYYIICGFIVSSDRVFILSSSEVVYKVRWYLPECINI